MGAGRPVGMGGYLPIPNVEMLAWSTLTGIKPKRWEIEAIRALDEVFLKVMNAKDTPPP